jgi:hypothetical protein
MTSFLGALIRVPFYFTLAFLLFGSPIVTKFQNPEINKELIPYVEQFIEKCNLYNVDCTSVDKFKIIYGEIPDSYIFKLLNIPLMKDVVGLCERNFNTITINSEYFNKVGPVHREMLVNHELGHCILGLQHVDNTQHLMNPYIIDQDDYVKYYQKIYDKIFSCNKNCPGVQWNRARYTP